MKHQLVLPGLQDAFITAVINAHVRFLKIIRRGNRGDQLRIWNYPCLKPWNTVCPFLGDFVKTPDFSVRLTTGLPEQRVPELSWKFEV